MQQMMRVAVFMPVIVGGHRGGVKHRRGSGVTGAVGRLTALTRRAPPEAARRRPQAASRARIAPVSSPAAAPARRPRPVSSRVPT